MIGNWRIYCKEVDWSDAKLLAWEIVLPERHLPILESDVRQAKKIEEILKDLLQTGELHFIGKRIKEKLKI